MYKLNTSGTKKYLGELDLSYFVGWHSLLWTPPVRWLLGSPERFNGKHVLEIGCGSGRMASLFGLFGASVLGVEPEGHTFQDAQNEAVKWGVTDKVRFTNYDGNPLNIPGNQFDFIFTKSVLVVIPDLRKYMNLLSRKVRNDGEIMLAENMQNGMVLRRIRRRALRLYRYHRWGSDPYDKFSGVNQDFLDKVGETFQIIEYKKYYGFVAAIRAINPKALT